MPLARLGRAFTLPLLLAVLATSASAAPDRKPPYWQSLRADEVNMRVGPGEDYGVRFVYHRKHLPVRVLRIKENWRLVEDPDGVRGWMVINFLSNERSATVRAGARPKCAVGAARMRASCGRLRRARWASWAIAGTAGAS
jgi:SH3-like domain-containing protein